MICRNPFVGVGGAAFRCGRCIACRVDRARVWKHRIMLEAKCNSDNCFLTLSYMDEKLPVLTGKDTGEILGTLRVRDLQLWLKRLRKVMHPLKIRYYACGEYGPKTMRPHYHVILFGFPSCLNLRTKCEVGTGRPAAWQCCKWCRLIYDTWGNGDVQLGSVNSASIGYTCDYVVKNLRRKDDLVLKGRYPEFARMSLRPGIGGAMLPAIVNTLTPLNGNIKDVPVTLKHDVGFMPLGRYMRSKVREGLGRERGCPNEVLLAYQESLRELRESARVDEANPSFKAHLIANFEGAVLNAEAKYNLFGAKKGKRL